jgi:AraC-like DNA-binding protein
MQNRVDHDMRTMTHPYQHIYEDYQLRDERDRPFADPLADHAVWLDPPGCVLIPASVDLPSRVRSSGFVKAGLYIGIVLQGTGESWLTNSSHRFCYSNNVLSALALREDQRLDAESRRDSRVRSVGVCYPLESLRRLDLVDAFDELFPDGVTFFHKMLPASPRIQAIASELIWPTTEGAARTLLLAAQASETLVRTLLLLQQDAGIDGVRSDIRVNLNIVKGAMDTDLRRPWTITELAEQAGLTRTSFHAKFFRAFGVGPMDYLRARRLEAAREALLYQGISVTDAAFQAGYTNPANFATAFRRRFGVAPSSLRPVASGKGERSDTVLSGKANGEA